MNEDATLAPVDDPDRAAGRCAQDTDPYDAVSADGSAQLLTP